MYLDQQQIGPANAGVSAPDAAPDPRVRAANAMLARAWARGWASVPSLDPQVLIAKASRTARADAALLPGDWRERLHLLTQALAQEAALSPLGLTIAHGQLVAAARTRIGMAALWQRRPEILQQPIAAPILVVGQMRSGTTRMQRLLACDPRLRFTRFHESWCPLPRLGRWIDDRPLRARLALGVARWLNPQFAAIHPTHASAPDEEIGLLSAALGAPAFEAQWRIPGFVRHCEAMDARPVYAEFRRMLQTIAWLRGGADSRPWILKVPQFTEDLAALLQVFPDARVVVVIRSPVQVVASSASLVHNQMRVQSDAVDAHWIGREWLRKVVRREQRMRDALAQADNARVEVAYGAMEADWRGEMGRVHAMLGLPLTDAVERRMAGEIAGFAGGRRRPHRYDLASFGLTPADIATAFADPQRSNGATQSSERCSVATAASTSAPSGQLAR